MSDGVPRMESLPERIREVAGIMMSIGIDMDYIGGLGELGAHGRELMGAAGIARKWADSIEAELVEARR